MNNPFIISSSNDDTDLSIDIFGIMEKVKTFLPKKYHKGISSSINIIDNSNNYEPNEYTMMIYIDHNKIPNMKNDMVIMGNDGKFIAEYKGYCYGGKTIGFYVTGLNCFVSDEAIDRIPEEDIVKTYQIETYLNGKQEYHRFNNSKDFYGFMEYLINLYGKNGTDINQYKTGQLF